VSLDLLVRGLLAPGATREEIARLVKIGDGVRACRLMLSEMTGEELCGSIKAGLGGVSICRANGIPRFR
jgi:hypothetical protein